MKDTTETPTEIWLFRHGEKAYAGHDPDLNSMGKLQAQKLAALVAAGELEKPHQLWTSPRQRAQNTFHPLASKQNIPLNIWPNLDQRFEKESSKDFAKRIQLSLEQMAQLRGRHFFCTHHDWLGEALFLIPSDQNLTIDYGIWQAGQYVQFKISDEIWKNEKHGVIRI